MSQPYVGEIRMFGGNFPPAGWAMCNGSLLSIADYQTLFALIGTTYGGDGQNTFAIPDLQGRVAVHQGQGPGLANYSIGQLAGNESIALNTQQMPQHNHTIQANSGNAVSSSPANNFLAAQPDFLEYTSTVDSTMKSTAIQNTGGSQPHENRMPILAISYIISLFGVFPSPN